MKIKIENVSFIYDGGANDKTLALKNINMTIEENEFIGIIGHTGSGKSTLVQHFNGLEKATSGTIYCDDKCIYDKDFDMKAFRCRVGLVFQYPEYQLFESTVLEDVCFGPKNKGASEEEATKKAIKALNDVGVDKELFSKSPFELSGGEKRRVAIAGILAMEPEVLILDEPTAGLDPKGRDRILNLVAELRKKLRITVIMVSHSMEDVAKYVDRLIVMNQGVVMFDDKPKKVFAHYKELEKVGLRAPAITYIMHQLSEKGVPVDMDIIDLDEATKQLIDLLK